MIVDSLLLYYVVLVARLLVHDLVIQLPTTKHLVHS